MEILSRKMINQLNLLELLRYFKKRKYQHQQLKSQNQRQYVLHLHPKRMIVKRTRKKILKTRIIKSKKLIHTQMIGAMMLNWKIKVIRSLKIPRKMKLKLILISSMQRKKNQSKIKTKMMRKRKRKKMKISSKENSTILNLKMNSNNRKTMRKTHLVFQ